MGAFDATSSAAAPQTHHGLKVFTREQANRTLPLVSRIMADVVRLDKEVSEFEGKITTAGAREPSKEFSAERDAYDSALHDLSELRDELSSIGCRLKDWRRGVVDFLAVHNGRLVELCWRLGEEHIGYWHELGAGFRGREHLIEGASENPSRE